MQNIYKVIGGGGGRCGCGHKQLKGKCYYLVDTGNRSYTLCEHCGKMRGLDRWWGAKEMITAEELQKHWFGGEPIKEVVCKRLPRYTKRSGNSSTKREEMLKVAVEV